MTALLKWQLWERLFSLIEKEIISVWFIDKNNIQINNDNDFEIIIETLTKPSFYKHFHHLLNIIFNHKKFILNMITFSLGILNIFFYLFSFFFLDGNLFLFFSFIFFGKKLVLLNLIIKLFYVLFQSICLL